MHYVFWAQKCIVQCSTIIFIRCAFILESPKSIENNAAAAKKVKKWEKLENELSKILTQSGLDKYKKETQVPTLRPSFRKSIAEFTKLYFPPDLKFKEFSDRLAFAKDHKDVNEICLNYAATGAIMKRKDCSNDIPSPVDTFPKETFFPQTNKSKYNKEHGSDYQVLFKHQSLVFHWLLITLPTERCSRWL